MSSTQSTARPYHHGALRSAVLDVGRKFLVEQGEDAFSLRQVAREVGVSATAVYRHFADKEALLRAIAAEGLEDIARSQEAAARTAGGGKKGFLAMGEAYVRFAVKNPAIFRLIFRYPPQHDPMDKRWGCISTAMAQLLEASADLKPAGVTARSFALHSWAVVHGLALLILDGQVPYDPRAVRDALRAAWRR